MKTIHKVKIDLLTPGLHPRVYAVQDDICTREVQISLYSGSVSWTPTSGAGVAVGYRKSDGTVGIYDTLPDGSSAVSISGNVVTLTLAAQMLTAVGAVETAVTLAEKSGNQITTFAFDVIVSANPGSGAIKSEDYFNYVNPKIQAVIEQAAAATTAANTAASRANASAELAEDAYDLADTANQKVDTLREVVSKLHSNIVETARGEVIQLSDASDLELAGLRIFGKTTQNGIPTPEAPVPLESVGESVNVTIEGAGMPPQVLPVTITNDLGMPGIPVPSGGNYTDSNGQQWICDEIDFEKGVYVQRVYRQTYTGSSNEAWGKSGTTVKDRFYTRYMVSNTMKPCLCNMAVFIPAPEYENGKCFVTFNSSNNAYYFEIIAGDYGTFADTLAWREYIEEHPLEVLYVLDEEKETPLSEIDPDALAQYATLHTNYPNTTIFNDAGADMEVKYVADTKLYIDKKFDELAAALVNNV